MRIFFAKPLEDMATFEALRDNEARTTEEEAEFVALLSTLEANEASINSAKSLQQSLYVGERFVFVTDEASASSAKLIATAGDTLVQSIVMHDYWGDSLQAYYNAL